MVHDIAADCRASEAPSRLAAVVVVAAAEIEGAWARTSRCSEVVGLRHLAARRDRNICEVGVHFVATAEERAEIEEVNLEWV